jgi:hypothetical protein
MKDGTEWHDSPVYVAPNEYLVDRDFYIERIWRPARQQHERLGGRTAWRTALKMLKSYEGRLYFPDGQRYTLAPIDRTFSDFRCIGQFLEPDKTGDAPRTFSRQYDRLRVIELFCRLKSTIDWGRPPPADGTLHPDLPHARVVARR